MTQDDVSAYTQALRYGLPDVAEILHRAVVTEDVRDEDLFMAACAAGDANVARRVKARRPDLPGALSEAQLRLLPELAAAGCVEPVRVMVELGWPVAVRGGDWSASALNHAVFGAIACSRTSSSRAVRRGPRSTGWGTTHAAP